VDSKNVTSRLQRQFNRRATQYQAANSKVRSDSEHEEICMYLVNSFQNAIRWLTLREGRMQMNGMALCLLLRIIEKALVQILSILREVSDRPQAPSWAAIRLRTQMLRSPC
jgi:hypothetical protein